MIIEYKIFFDVIGVLFLASLNSDEPQVPQACYLRASTRMTNIQSLHVS